MSGGADVVVIGAGPNGLTAAARLSKAGLRVVVLEARGTIGGLAAGEEFHPGYRGPGPLHDAAGLRPAVVEELDLTSHGLRLRSEPPAVVAVDGDGAALRLGGGEEPTAVAIEQHSAGDGEAWRRYRAHLAPQREVLRQFLDEPPVDLIHAETMGIWELGRRALRLRRLGRRDMMELFRLPTMSVADGLGEWFRSDLLKAALALPAVAGTWMGPRSPGSNLNLLLAEAAAGTGVQGGAVAVVEALARCARAHGAEIRTGARVDGILLDGGAVRGVRLAEGEEVSARQVAASCHPARLLLDLLPPGSIPYRLEHRLARYRSRGTTAHVLLALSAPPEFRGWDGPVELARLAGSLDAIERAFDAVKYRRISERPVLEVRIPTACDPSLAPEGHAVASILVHYAPYHREPEWDDAARDQLGDLVLDLLEAHAPGVRGSVVARQTLTPHDLEARYAIPGGHIHHGEHALDQILVRPVPECARYATPIRGLFLCGSGSHPGGGLTCAPGALAAAAMLDRARS